MRAGCPVHSCADGEIWPCLSNAAAEEKPLRFLKSRSEKRQKGWQTGGGWGCDTVVWSLLSVFIQSLVLRGVGWPTLERNVLASSQVVAMLGCAGGCWGRHRQLGILGNPGGGYGRSLEAFNPA